MVLLKELQGNVSPGLLGGSDVESTSCWKPEVSEEDEEHLEHKDNKDLFLRLSCWLNVHQTAVGNLLRPAHLPGRFLHLNC